MTEEGRNKAGTRQGAGAGHKLGKGRTGQGREGRVAYGRVGQGRDSVRQGVVGSGWGRGRF